MRYLRANHIIDAHFNFIENAVLIVTKDGVIQSLLNPLEHKEDIQSIEKSKIEKFEGLLAPGFVNTHCHLELSYLKNEVKEKTGLSGFVSEVEQKKQAKSDFILECISNAEKEMLQNGIVAVGDISNTINSVNQKQKENLYYHTFVECYASNKQYANKAFQNSLKVFETFSELNSNKNKASITPHAPYSVSKELFQKLNDWITNNRSIVSIHNQECEDENKMFTDGSGNLARFIQSFGTDLNDFTIGKKSVHSYIDKLPSKNNLQLVHNTYSELDDIQIVNKHYQNSYWCFCPNANLFIENTIPKIDLFIQENCKITVGTDSLASNHQLSILEELKSIQKLYPEVKLADLIQWATLNGAEFLQIENTYGSFSKGKKPGVVLIENMDLKGLSLSKESTCRRII